MSKPAEKDCRLQKIKRSPQVIIKSKLSSNPMYQGSASEMILIQFSHPQSVIRERNRGNDLEMIWKRFGDAKQNSQELEKKFESAILPGE